MKRTEGKKLLKKVWAGSSIHFVSREKYSKESVVIVYKKCYLKLFWNMQLSSPFLQRFKIRSFCKADFSKLAKGQWFSLYFSKCKAND